MQYNKNKFLGILVMVFVILAMVVPVQAATWDTTRVYTGTVTLYDVAVGDKIKGASDDTVRIFCGQAGSPYRVLLFTDRSSALPMSWAYDSIMVDTAAIRGVAIGDPDGDGDNDLIWGRSGSPYRVKRAYWDGSAWVKQVLGTLPSSIYDLAIGDADNDGSADDIIATSSYHVFRVHWNGASWDTTRIYHGASTTGTMYGVAIGDFDAANAGNEIVAVSSQSRALRIRWTGAAWDTLTIFYNVTPSFYDVTVGDFDASNAGEEIAVNNGAGYATVGAVIELYGSGTSWNSRALYTPATWSSSGEIRVGDFFTTNPGAEIVAVSGGSPYEARLVYGSGTTWSSEQIMVATSSTYGCAVGNVNRYHPGNEVAIASYYRVFEAEQRLLNNDMAAISIDGVPSMAETDEIITIKATVRNNAEYTANAPIPVKMRIDGPLGYVYTDVDQATSLNLAPGGTEQIIFSPDWIVPDTLCSYTIKAWTELPGDEVPANDTVTKIVTVIRVGGLVESFTGTTFPPPGWTVYNFFTTADDAWSRYTVYYNSAPACARIYYDLPNNDWLITPRLRVVDGDKLKFWWRTQSTSYQETLFVRVSTNPDVSDTGAYTVIDLVTSTGNISWREQVTDLSSYAGQDIYIAFWYRCYNFYGVAIDDVSGPYFPPKIATSPDDIYMESFPDSFFDVFFTVGNIGGGSLNYTASLAGSSSWATVHPTSGSLLGGEQDEDTISINTTGMDGHYYDTLVITSNSGEKATTLIPIHLWVRLIPDITVSPDSLSESVEGNGTKDANIFLSNSGNGNLEYTIETEEWSKVGATFYGEPATREHHFEDWNPEDKDNKDALDPRRGIPPTKGQGGPDLFGYRWIDSDEPGGPIFNWIEINSIGTQVLPSDDGNVGPYAIGFPFEFYGVTFDSFRIASNGFATFTSTSGTLTNATIPTTGEPNNLLALNWDDLRAASGGGAGNIYYHSNASRLVIEWDHVMRYAHPECPYTMEIILYPNGKIIYQYLTMGEASCSTYHAQSTIGIENGTGTDGLEVVFNALYMHDNLAIRFSEAPAWLAFSPEFGSIPPTEADTIDVTFDATGILSGDFYGAFIINSNDPDTPVDTVPAHMHILTPDMTFTPASIETSGTEGQAPFNVTMDVGNAGAASLFFNIVESVPWLSVSPLADTIPPGDPASTITLTIDCTNLYAGNYIGTLKVYSNDPDLQPYATFDISLHVGPNPDIAVDPGEFNVGVYGGYTKDTSMTISNTGDGHLVWGITIEEVGKGPDTVLYEGFEGTFPPAGWTVVNNDGGTMQWEQSTLYYHNGTKSANCRWETTTLWNDDWLITPRISIGSNDSLVFWQRVYTASNPESLEIRLSTTTNDVSAFTTLLWAGSQLTNTTWEERKIELGKYSRGQVYLAFVYKGLFEWRIYVDDVSVMSYAGPWLTVDPLSDVTNPHSERKVNLNFSAVGYNQDKDARLWITSNDPDESPVYVPVHMSILGPNYSVSPPETLVIDALEDQFTDGHVFMQNYSGHAPLAYKITDPVDWLSESPDTAEVPIDNQQDVTVTVDGYQLIAGDYATKLYIKSNDFTTPNDTLVVVVHVGPPPDISVTPDSFVVSVPAGGTSDATLTINNDGDGHLAVELATEETGPVLSPRMDLNPDRVNQILSTRHDYAASEPLFAGMANDNPPNLTSGMPSSPGAPIRAKGDTVYVQWPHDPTDTWSFGTTDAGAGYKLYENFWGVTLPIKTIEWWGLCLKYTGSSWVAGNPNNLRFNVIFYSDPADDPTMPPDQVACTFTNVAPTVVATGIMFTTGAGTFEMYKFTGLEVNPLCDLPEGWVSIQSQSAGTGNDWLLWASAKTGDGFSYQQGSSTPNTVYDRAMLMTGGAAWLSVSPEADTVNPHSTADINVHFDATTIMGGEKFGNIIINSNDPDENPLTVPVHMIIAGAQYSIHPEELHINALENQVASENLTVLNPGGLGPLSYKMTWSQPWLTANPDTADVPPDGSQIVIVRVDGNLLIAGDYYGEIWVKCNAANQQRDTIPVYVHVGPDPDIAVTPMNMPVPVIPGVNREENLRVDNLGLGHLSFFTEIEPAGPLFVSVTTRQERDLNKVFGRDKQPNVILPPAGTPVAKNGEVAPQMTTPSKSPGADFSLPQTKDVLLSEGFEGSWLPAGWTMIQNNTGSQGGYPCFWSQMTVYVHSGSYSAGLWWSYYYQDEWLISPEMSVAGACTLSFWTYGYLGSTYGDHYYVMVTTDNGANWAPVFDLSALTGGWNYFASPFYVDLSAYSGQTIKLAWYAQDPTTDDGIWYAWLIDDILVWSTKPPCAFTVAPEADTINPSSFEDLIVTFDGAAFDTCAEETLTCNLVFSTNDPDEPTVTVPISAFATRGDMSTPLNLIDIGDVVFLINFVLKNGPAPSPLCMGDCDHDGMVDLADVVCLIQYLFLQGQHPLATPETRQPGTIK